tara:strand:+ start:271 stop:465 length:195 start_codon:yes stop_codon:yes gene_type:complete
MPEADLKAFDSGITVTHRRDRPSMHDEGSAEVALTSEPAGSADVEAGATASATTQPSNIITTTP